MTGQGIIAAGITIGGFKWAGSFTAIDLIAATTNALNGALLARRPDHYKNFTVVGILAGGLTGGTPYPVQWTGRLAIMVLPQTRRLIQRRPDPGRTAAGYQPRRPRSGVTSRPHWGTGRSLSVRSPVTTIWGMRSANPGSDDKRVARLLL